MSAYWKFNTYLLDIKYFQDQLNLKQELTGTIVGNKCWDNIKSRITSFAEYGHRQLISTDENQI